MRRGDSNRDGSPRQTIGHVEEQGQVVDMLKDRLAPTGSCRFEWKTEVFLRIR